MEIKTIQLSIYDGLELKEATFKNKSFPEHFHDSYSIGIIEQGTERLSYGHKEVLAHAHTVAIINPYDIHANRYFDSDSWKYRAIYVGIELMQFIQDQTGVFRGNEIWFPQQLIEDIYLYQLLLHFHINPCREAAQLDNILTYIIHQYAQKRPDKEHKNSGITDAAQYLSTHFADKLSVASIATQYGMDQYKFIRQFKKQTGLTPVSYMMLQRINRSKSLIKENMPITHVALETGFYDQSHFTHYFQRYIGVSPLQYKKGLFDIP